MTDKESKYSMMAVKDLIPNARNARTHSEDQIDKIAKSIKEFGFINPIIVDKKGIIIAGHGRLLGAKKLDMKEVPTILADHLTKKQVRAYMLADNRLAELAGWDEDILSVELAELSKDFELDDLGFDDTWFTEGHIKGLTDEDDCPEVDEGEPVSKLGDIYILGDHRLMCGDSTDADTVAKLMNGDKADMVFTDPPYNVAFNGRSGKFDVIKNDKISEKDFSILIDAMCKIIKHLDPSAYYIWCNWKFYGVLQDKMEYKTCIVWAKNNFGLGVGYRHQHEFCLYNGNIDEDIKNESDLWEINKDTSYVHPTQKPVELALRAIGNHGDVLRVIDLFGGSGSTLIACEKTERKCYMMELDPHYIDVIIKRWQEFTGQKAINQETGEAFNG